MEDVPEWEKSKENVQPRKQGRSVAKLAVGLSARTEIDSQAVLKAEKEKFELALRSYQGDDPLCVWHDYINWTEQNFPSGGKAGHLSELLKSLITQFKQEKRYYGDERFVRHWITFAELCQEPREIYSYMNSQGIGVKLAIFYKAWAESLEESGDSQTADQVLAQGITAKAYPLDILQSFRNEFQMRTCRQLMNKMNADGSDDEGGAFRQPERQGLVSLSSTSRGRIAVDRVAAARPEQRVILKSLSRETKQSMPQTTLNIFTDENSEQTSAKPNIASSSKQYKVIPDERIHKENTKDPGKWTKSSSSSSQMRSVDVVSAPAAAFEIHTDDNDRQVAATPSKTTTLGPHLGLSVKKAAKPGMEEKDTAERFLATVSCDFVVDIPMYNKTKVYAGLVEYSFEELRAIRWRKEQEQKQRDKEDAERLAAQQQRLEEYYKALLAQSAKEQQVNQNNLLQTINDMAEKLKLLGDRVKQMESSNNSTNQKPEDKFPHSTEAVVNVSCCSTDSRTPKDKGESFSQSFKRHRTPDNSSSKRSLVKHSPFNVTQDCAHVMNGFFNQTLSNPPTRTAAAASNLFMSRDSSVANKTAEDHQLEERRKAKSVEAVQPSGNKFTIFSDEAGLAPVQPLTNSVENKPASAFNVFNALSSKPALSSAGAFKIFSDGDDNSCPTEAPSTAETQHQGFSVFTDPPQTNIDGADRRKPKKSVGFSIFNDENAPPPVASSQSSATESAGASGAKFSQTVFAGSAFTEVMDYQTDYDLPSKFATLHAGGMSTSTPFHSVQPIANLTCDSKLDEQSVEKENGVPAPVDIPAYPQAEFAPTQSLSPIIERSRESNSSTSRNMTSSCSTLATGSGLSRTRSQSSSSDTDTSESQIDSLHTKSRLHFTNVHPTLDAVTELGESSIQSQSTLDKTEVDVMSLPPQLSADLLPEHQPLQIGNATIIDTTHYAAPEITEANFNTTVFIDPSNPFNEKLQHKFLKKVDFNAYECVEFIDKELPKLKKGSVITVCDMNLKVTAKLGEGGFATAYKASVISKSSHSSTASTSKLSNTTLNHTTYNDHDELCIKSQNSEGLWELYICKELRNRLEGVEDEIYERDILTKLMDVSHASIYSNGLLLINELVPFGSLLNVVNGFRCSRKMIPESLIYYITIELLHAVETLHRFKIIHGDIKPDNILFLGFPEVNDFSSSSIKLIDFGRAIDMSKFPQGTTFTASNETEGFICIEMKTGQPWTYQTDLFGIVATVYSLLFNNYMTVAFKNGKWVAQEMKMHRQYNASLWTSFIEDFLNIPSCDDIPCITEWRERFEEEFNLISEKSFVSESVQANRLLQISSSTSKRSL